MAPGCAIPGASAKTIVMPRPPGRKVRPEGLETVKDLRPPVQGALPFKDLPLRATLVSEKAGEGLVSNAKPKTINRKLFLKAASPGVPSIFLLASLIFKMTQS